MNGNIPKSIFLSSYYLSDMNKDKYTKYKFKYLNDKSDDWADYIVVGAGAAGCVVAGRLAESMDANVLVLELGPDNGENPDILDPSEPSLLWNHPDGPNPSPTCLNFKTNVQLDRTYHYPRGNGAGGSVNHHALIDGLGSYKIYDNIGKLVNDEATWGSENVWKYFKKMESYNNIYNTSNDHGHDGWLQLKPCNVTSPVQKDFIFAANKLFSAPIRYDFASNRHDVAGVGLGNIQIDQNGLRSNSFSGLLKPLLKRGNVKIMYNTIVSRVVLDEGTHRAVGVEALMNDHYSVDCTVHKENPLGRHFFNARKEIILCGGAINTPQLLMLSGIGPKDHLKEHHIKPVIDLPGVGTDVMDHHECGLTFEIDPTKYVWAAQAAKIIKNKPNAKLKQYLEQFIRNESPDVGDNQVFFDWFSGLDSDGKMKEHIVNDDDPDLHIHSAAGFFFDFDFKSTQPLPNGKQRIDYFHSQTDLNHPEFPRVFHNFLLESLKLNRADGTIRLASSDPKTPPIIDIALYKDDIACERLARGILMIRAIVNHPTLKKYYKLDDQNRVTEILPGYKYETIPQLKDYLKRFSSIGHHISGSCAMKVHNGSNKQGVVDSKLRVLGVENLRIADTSIYPYPFLHGYNTSRGAYVVGEIAADLIKI
ncbi:MAG: glucose-methanol-choline oxidoreductase [Hyperionvirus sp.]|uniref:Glucose-methanol-choline oxidoreductase n=1 Tax=Hyperionvirus sp. TaxID=2487770 RepID=A0A3G5A8N1_9VIRU|nr:MAG: glucose-methanol-choline oxidoreductase [Hyperionvirus sp.]